MSKKPPTKAERQHMSRVAALGCWCCLMDGHRGVTAQLHHIREGYGMGQRASHFEVIPLCEGHHQGLIDATKRAFHQSPKLWRARYGMEREVLRAVLETLDLMEAV